MDSWTVDRGQDTSHTELISFPFIMKTEGQNAIYILQICIIYTYQKVK